jgi:hypothetical protein
MHVARAHGAESAVGVVHETDDEAHLPDPGAAVVALQFEITEGEPPVLYPEAH